MAFRYDSNVIFSNERKSVKRNHNKAKFKLILGPKVINKTFPKKLSKLAYNPILAKNSQNLRFYTNLFKCLVTEFFHKIFFYVSDWVLVQQEVMLARQTASVQQGGGIRLSVPIIVHFL